MKVKRIFLHFNVFGKAKEFNDSHEDDDSETNDASSTHVQLDFFYLI